MTIGAREALRRATPILDARPLLIVSDFDGTISRISLDPWGATILPAAQRALRRLAAIPGVHVAILSGRVSRDVASRARIGGASYVGNFGMERGNLPRGSRAERLEVEVVDVPAALVRLANDLATTVPAEISEPWLVVEHKPASVAFHFRGAPDVEAAGRWVRETIDRLEPNGAFLRVRGKRVLELRPAGAPDKGHAMRALLDEHRPGAAIVLGDDVTDALAFDALREASTNGRSQSLSGLSIAVKARDEVLQSVADASDLVLDSPMEAARFLSGLARLVATAATAATRPR